jgi:4-hydroxymandelate oxidase
MRGFDKMPDKETSMAGQASPSPAMPSRRMALGVMGTAAAVGAAGAAMPARAQTAIGTEIVLPMPPPMRAPQDELVSLFKYEEQARLVLGSERIAPIVGSDRTVTDRITIQPRVCISARDMDLTVTLFGDQHFAPVIVGPMARQARFHAEGEVATARGASAAKAAMILSSDSSVPLATVAQAATTPLWLQVYPNNPRLSEVLAEAGAARAVVVTVNAGASSDGSARPGAAINWAGVEAVVKATSLPVIVKGVTTPQEAREAVARGAQGVVVSNYRGGNAADLPGTLLLVEPVVQAVGDRATVLVDGSFRYGSDVLKALSFGAKAVLIGRPVMWGLASYGADGVKGAVEMLQTDFARFMGMCGLPTIASIHRDVAKVHAPMPVRSTTNV